MVSQQDLLDLDPDDYKFIEMRPLEVGATCTNCRKLSPPCVVFIQYSTNIEGMPLLKKKTIFQLLPCPFLMSLLPHHG